MGQPNKLPKYTDLNFTRGRVTNISHGKFLINIPIKRDNRALIEAKTSQYVDPG